MKVRIGISIRMILLIVLSAVVIFNGTIKIIGIYYKKTAYSEIVEENTNQAAKISHKIQVLISNNFSTIGSLASNIQALDIKQPTDIDYLKLFMEKFISSNPQFEELSFSLSLMHSDSTWQKDYGRVKYQFLNTAYGLEQKVDTLDTYGHDESSSFYHILTNGTRAMSPLTWSSKPDSEGKKYLSSQCSTPILINDTVVGSITLSSSLKEGNLFIDSLIQITENNKTVIANNGIILHHPSKKYIGKNIQNTDTLLTNQFAIINKINQGKSFQLNFKNYKGVDSVYLLGEPIAINQTNTHWTVLSTISLEDADQSITESLALTKRLGSFGLFILGIIILLFSRSMIIPLRKSANILNLLSKGQVNQAEKLEVKSGDEVGEMGRSVNTLINRLNNITIFSEEIGKGNFNSEFNLASENDVLGKSILDMRNSLEVARKEELNRIKEKEQLNWASEGINLFNKILRVDNQNLENLTYDIIKTLTNYVGAHVGGIYLQSNNDEQIYELTSYIGFSKERYNNKRLSIHDGDIGRCILEKETIFMNDIPDAYSKIGSGLGFSKPSSILVVPLISNENLVGILALESLKNMEQYQIDFIEKLAETIGSTAASVKINVRTTELLTNSQKQAEELEQQEEEMRQNMEEMQATQEEAKKHEDELISLIEGYNKNLLTAEYDIRERLTDINDNYLKLYKVSKSQIIGKQHKADLFMDETEQKKHKEFWSKLLKGLPQESIAYIKTGKDNFWIMESFIPIKDTYGAVNKVLCVGFDITEERKIESQLKLAKEGGLKTTKIKNSDNKKSDKPSIDLNRKLKIIDLAYLKMVYKKDPHKIYNILKVYYDTLPQQVNELNSLNKDADLVKLKSKINSLKTKMSYLGLKKIYTDLGKIEKVINDDKNIETIQNILNIILAEWTQASKELEKLLGY